MHNLSNGVDWYNAKKCEKNLNEFLWIYTNSSVQPTSFGKQMSFDLRKLIFIFKMRTILKYFFYSIYN